MPRCETPDHLIGVGGNGSKVVYRFMEQDWILEEVLATDEYELDDPDELHATTIDSATDDQHHDTRGGPIERDIESLIEDSEYSKKDEHITFTRNQIVESIPGNWTRADTLTAPKSIERLAADTGLTSWWLERGREPLTKMNDEGFSGGVQRRRAVSKMLYHIAEHEGDSVAPSTNNNDEVYVVAPLGGGTGSGMALDLASDLDNERIHLIGILPHSDEKRNEKTNALAALSELEYAALSGEGPFDTMTLVPYIESVPDSDFEMAVVRTILAHVNGMKGGNFTGEITPGGNNAPPEYAPFTLAAPHTILYDIGLKPRAEDAVDDALTTKQEQLDAEADLYEVVETFFTDTFSDADPGELTDPDGLDEATELRKRIDAVRGRLLDQESLEAADVQSAADEIAEEIDLILEGEGGPVNVPDVDDDSIETRERDRRLIDDEDAPNYIKERLSNELDYDETDTLRHDLLKVTRQEFENIEARRDLWKLTAGLTADATGLSESRARMIRGAFREVILDETEGYISSVLDPTIKDELETISAQSDDAKARYDHFETFYDEVHDELTSSIHRWRDEVGQQAETLAAINRHWDDATDEIDTLQETLETKLEKISEADDAANVSATIDFNFKTLNEKLEAMGVTPIDDEALTGALGDVADARRAHLEHNSGLLPGKPDKSREFNTAVGENAETNYFSLNPRRPETHIDDPFKAELTDDGAALERDTEIENARETVIKSMKTTFREVFGGNDGQFSTSRLSDVTDETPIEELEVPNNPSLSTVVSTLDDALDAATDPESASELLDTIISVQALATARGADDDDDVPSMARNLYESYLRPIDAGIDDAKADLRTLGDNDVVDEDGVYEVFEQVDALAGNASSVDEEVALKLPTANPNVSDNETYGRDFASNDRLYDIKLEENFQSTDDFHPYISRKKAEPSDITADPEHIGESDVIENHVDDIVGDFANSIDWLLGNRFGRGPLNTFEPRGNEDLDNLTPEYEKLRVRPVYMSRGFEQRTDKSKPFYDEIEAALNQEMYLGQNDIYAPEIYDSGSSDEISLVLFIGGIILDNIELVTERGGYAEVYDRNYRESEFIGSHHSIGLGGRWDYWRTLGEWAGDCYDGDGAFGAYLHRETFGDPTDPEFMNELMRHEASNNDDENVGDDFPDVKQLFYDRMHVDVFESTIDL